MGGIEVAAVSANASTQAGVGYRGVPSLASLNRTPNSARVYRMLINRSNSASTELSTPHSPKVRKDIALESWSVPPAPEDVQL
jgi:hypothetical protein